MPAAAIQSVSDEHSSMRHTNSRWNPSKIAATVAVVFLISAPVPIHADTDIVEAVMTSGSGRLTTCRSWLVYNSCTTHKVLLPERVAVGDQLKLSYGSNPKNYTFHVALIRREGDRCRVLSASSGPREDGEKIEIAHCRPAANPGAEAR